MFFYNNIAGLRIQKSAMVFEMFHYKLWAKQKGSAIKINPIQITRCDKLRMEILIKKALPAF